MDSFYRVEVPTPFDIGTVNSYVFAGETLTILDPGPDTDEAFEAVVDGLQREDHDITDVDRVLVTHPHIDHFGCAERISRAADASVIAHADAAAIMADMESFFHREQAFFDQFLVSMGVPESMADVITKVPEPYLSFQRPVTVDRTVTHGDIVGATPRFTCLHTPGHAPGSMCFHVANERVTFTGDHVLSEITPNPVLTVEVDDPTTRTRSLPTYLASLERLLAVDTGRGFGGHRRPMPDLHDRIRETITHHRDRKEHMADLLASEGPSTAYELTRELFPGLPSTEMFLGISEVVGHLDLLEDEGRVEIADEEGVSSYALVAGP